MVILGIETSCDETSAAIVSDRNVVESLVTTSSSDAFSLIGGVIPEEAARKQMECILPVIDQSLRDAKRSWSDIDAIAVTKGPGLLGSLLVGTTTARALGAIQGKPLIGVHHIRGHLDSVWLDRDDDLPFPCLTLAVSGGHTQLFLRSSHTKEILLGTTQDDAAGEAFDKAAKLLGLPYPGGPALAALAQDGDAARYAFPQPLARDESLDFSFSGLKTALRYLLEDLGALSDEQRKDIAASFERAICLHLIDRVTKALTLHPTITDLHLVGGVSANGRLRSMLGDVLGARRLITPMKSAYCTDNAAMIALAGMLMMQEDPDVTRRKFTTIAHAPLAHGS